MSVKNPLTLAGIETAAFRFVAQQPPSSTEVKERVELHLCSPSGVSWHVLG